LLVFGLLLFANVLARAQLRPEVTAAPKPAQIVIQTSPNAEVYLDDTFKGKASAQGRLVIDNPKPGEHALRISLAGKKEYERSVKVVAGQVARVSAVLADIQKPEVPKPVAGPATVVVETSPGAQVYLDDTFKGQASPQGRLVIENPKPGHHSLRVTLAGKKDYEQQITVVAGQTANVQATLADLAGSVKVQTSAGAEVFLDNLSRGTADAAGQLVVEEVTPGSHDLRASARGKKEFRQSITVLAGQENTVEAPLAELAGVIHVRTTPGAGAFLDNLSRGTADAAGQLVLQEVGPGSHDLRVSAQGKKEFRQSITVLAGQEATIEARLDSLGPPSPGETRESPKDGLKYVWVPPGTFMMGCSPGDDECADWEKPSHEVTITRGFWIGQTPVTAGAYKRYAGATGRQMPDSPSFNNRWANESMPIVNVTWDDAQAYCGWMGGRLPTEAEWEYAARGGTTEARYGNLQEIAWYSSNSGGQTHDVAQKRANRFELYDTLGNVWQWVSDWYDENYYRSTAAQDPQGPASGRLRVLRGGSWVVSRQYVRVSVRLWYYPGYGDLNVVGLRCGGEVGNP
jgi:formylglycine-generating enzyme required for sulfatase activity